MRARVYMIVIAVIFVTLPLRTQAQDAVITSSAGDIRIADAWTIQPKGQPTVIITDPSQIQSIQYEALKSLNFLVYQRVNHWLTIRFLDGATLRDVRIQIPKEARCFVHGVIIGRRISVSGDSSLRAECGVSQ